MTPAMVGAVALVVAAFGSTASPDNSSDQAVGQTGFQTVAGHVSRDPHTLADHQVDVSRDFDRGSFDRQVRAQAAQQATALRELGDLARERSKKLTTDERRRNQWVLPVTGYRLTARFGQRSGLWSSGVHTGLDFAGPSGTKIVAIGAGTVKSAGYDGSYGNRTIITLLDGTEIWYCHQSRIVVKAGDQVKPGQLTGYTGATGNVTGPHLHLEIRPPGRGAMDPEPILRQHGIQP